jgi:hypothetical protein
MKMKRKKNRYPPTLAQSHNRSSMSTIYLLIDAPPPSRISRDPPTYARSYGHANLASMSAQKENKSKGKTGKELQVAFHKHLQRLRKWERIHSTGLGCDDELSLRTLKRR